MFVALSRDSSGLAGGALSLTMAGCEDVETGEAAGGGAVTRNELEDVTCAVGVLGTIGACGGPRLVVRSCT